MRGALATVQIGRDAMQSLDEIDNPTGSMEAISITPVLQGAGGGADLRRHRLDCRAIVLGPIGLGVLGATGAIGRHRGCHCHRLCRCGLILGGASQLLSPTISDSPGTFGAQAQQERARDSFTPENNEIAGNRASYIFNGAVN